MVNKGCLTLDEMVRSHPLVILSAMLITYFIMTICRND